MKTWFKPKRTRIWREYMLTCNFMNKTAINSINKTDINFKYKDITKIITRSYSEGFNRFISDYIETDQIFFDKLKEILNTNKITITNKQRRIEKLMNVYLLKKEENKLELNPL